MAVLLRSRNLTFSIVALMATSVAPATAQYSSSVSAACQEVAYVPDCNPAYDPCCLYPSVPDRPTDAPHDMTTPVYKCVPPPPRQYPMQCPRIHPGTP